MPRKLNKAERNRANKQRDAEAFEVATQVRILAERLPNQAALRTMLISEGDPVKRKLLYDYVKPFLKFASVFPSTLDHGELIAPGMPGELLLK